MTELAERIRQLRDERDLSLEKAANMLEPPTTGKTWAKWERGREEPNLANFRALARFFGVSANYLLGWSDDRTPKTDADGEPGPAASATEAGDQAAALGDARRADRRQRPPRRGSTRRPGA